MLLFLTFLLAMSITAVLIPLLSRWAPALGLTDAPGPRKVHAQPVPRVGGIAMTLGFLLPASLLIAPAAPGAANALRGLLAGVVVLLCVGVWDDRRDLDYRIKFCGQIAAVALCLAVGGVRIEFLSDTYTPPAVLSTALTFLFIVGVTNAVNLSDGLDGLAGGMALLCFCAIALLAAGGGNVPLAALAATQAGALLGFLRFNTHPARIFMGDGGSQVLGFMIAVLAILATQSETLPLSAALPLLLVGMPIIDTLTVMVHRMRHGHSPFTADRNHLHHRLLGLGFSHGEAVILLYLLQVVLFLLAYFLRFQSDLAIIAVFGLFASVLLWLLHTAARSGWRAHAGRPAAQASWLAAPQRLLQPIPQVTLWVMSVGLIAYAGLVILATPTVGADVTVLCLLLLVPLMITAIIQAQGAITWLERLAAYVAVVLLVYLDQLYPERSHILQGICWLLLAVTGAAALLRFWFTPGRRFQLTALDVLVVFIALVVPNLPGDTLGLPPDLPAGIAKAVVLLYVVEMLLGLDLQRRLPRLCLILTLGAVAARGALTLSS